jgi:hypothetical protein
VDQLLPGGGRDCKMGADDLSSPSLFLLIFKPRHPGGAFSCRFDPEADIRTVKTLLLYFALGLEPKLFCAALGRPYCSQSS